MDRLYVLIRTDLPPAYQGVQAGHAVAEFVLRHPSTWRNKTLIYLGVRDDKVLRAWGERLTRLGIRWVGFHEPDIGNQLTAIATVCAPALMKGLRLWHTGECQPSRSQTASERSHTPIESKP